MSACKPCNSYKGPKVLVNAQKPDVIVESEVIDADR